MNAPARGAALAAATLLVVACGGREAKPDSPVPDAPAPAASLFTRLGGMPAIEAVVKDFAARVLADPRINAKFAKSDPNRVVSMLIEQVCNATGGPCTYTGRSMKETHANMGVTEGEFSALVEDLVAALNHAGVAAADQQGLLTALGTMKADIVEVAGSSTATPLPSSFAPWKPPTGQ
ncbi:MAG: group I truncated hemoglobin [Gemmatimonadales bacterium]